MPSSKSAPVVDQMDKKCAEAPNLEDILGSSQNLLERKNSLPVTSEEETLDANKIQDNKFALLLPTFKTTLKLLLVFGNTDLSCDALKRAAEKVGFEVTLCSTYDSAFEEYQSKQHDLVIIDSRSSKHLDHEALCRSIRNMKGNQHTPLIAVVKKSTYERDEGGIVSLLQCGFNRCIIESTSVTSCVNEIVQLKISDVKPMAIRATSQALYAALDKCNSLVIITDENYKCQYANLVIEKFLGIRQEEIVGKHIADQIIYDPIQLNAISSSLLRSKEWYGPLNLKKKTQEGIQATCRAISIACSGRLPTHFVMILDLFIPQETGVLAQPRGSVHSLRRGSNEARMSSDYLRRTSIAKLVSMPLEAPFTRIVSLIDQARDLSGPNVQITQLLDKAEDILRCSELYSPQLREDYRIKPEEPIVSDLITALLNKQPQPTLAPTSRRSSNDSAIYRPSRGSSYKVSSALNELLDTGLNWEFEIFRLEEMTKRRPLQHLGMHLFAHFDVANTLNCDEKILNNWLTIIEAHYHTENTYHNSTHAADVMQATAVFLEKGRIKSIMEPLDEVICLVAAAAHDVDHPGKSSAFLANCDSHLAILYNDTTILESHHAALMFKLTLGDERVNIFKNLDRDTYKIARHNIIDMILATEMTKHFEHLAKFVNVFCTKTTDDSPEEEDQDFVSFTNPENITLIKRMLIKCSDVSNPTRPFRLYLEWARRIAEEYFQQTDDEKTKGLPIVMPMFDRNTCSVPKSQIGFVDYIINDMFEAWNAFIDMPEIVTYMRQNYIRWKEFDESGLTTLADIRTIQNNVLMAPANIPPKSTKKE